MRFSVFSKRSSTLALALALPLEQALTWCGTLACCVWFGLLTSPLAAARTVLSPLPEQSEPVDPAGYVGRGKDFMMMSFFFLLSAFHGDVITF